MFRTIVAALAVVSLSGAPLTARSIPVAGSEAPSHPARALLTISIAQNKPAPTKASKTTPAPRPAQPAATAQNARADNETVFATGYAPIDTDEPNGAKAFIQAREAALAQALRNLAMVTQGARVKSTSSSIITEVDSRLSAVEIVSERTITLLNSPAVEVVVARKTGKAAAKAPNAPATEAVAAPVEEPAELPAPDEGPSITKVADSAPFDAGSVDPYERLREIPAAAVIAEPNYTSIIIDARRCGLKRSMSPKILNDRGRVVWDAPADPDYVIEKGIVAYVKSVEEAYANERAGKNPLLIEAIGRGDSPYRSDPAISMADAERMLAVNKKSRLLDRHNVIIIID